MIASRTPATVWVPCGPDGVDLDEVLDAARQFGDAPLIVKDYVKSRKHEWEEACFIPSAHDEDRLRSVVSTFLERQGEDLVGGVVLRELVDLQSVGTHPKSGMPLTREHRVFVLDGEPLVAGRCWSDGEYSEDDLPLAELALGRDGEWRIIELRDAQVAGLLDTIEPEQLYRHLHDRVHG